MYQVAAHAILPDGFQRLGNAPADEEDVVVIEIRNASPREPQWWQHLSTPLPTLCVATRTFHYRGQQWLIYQYHHETQSTTLEPVEESPNFQQHYCISPSSPGDDAGGWELRRGQLLIFVSHLRGPVDIAATPQELAVRVRGTVPIAFEMQWNAELTTYGFLAWPGSLDEFHERVVQSVRLRTLRNFYETVVPDVPLNLFLDVDGKFSDFPELRERPWIEIVQCVLVCLEEAFRECYDTQEPLSRADVLVLDASSEHKVSLHPIGASGRFRWRSAVCMRAFVQRVRARIFSQLLPGRRFDKMRRTALVDCSVYDPWKKFRFLHNTKRGEQRYLRDASHLVPGCWRLRSFAESTIIGGGGGGGGVVLAQPGTHYVVPLLIRDAEVDAAIARGELRLVDELRVAPGNHMHHHLPAGVVDLANAHLYEAGWTFAGVEPFAWTHIQDPPFAPLWNFLQPFLVADGPHNLRWLRVGCEARFLVPEAHLDELPVAMAQCPVDRWPLLLHEALSHAEWLKVAVDLERLPAHLDLGDVIAHLKALLQTGDEVNCEVCESPPQTAGTRSLHLIFQCCVRGARVFAALLRHLADRCPAEWTMDSTITSLRTLGSDKYSVEDHACIGRPKRYLGVQGNAYARCSLLVGAHRLPEVPFQGNRGIPPPLAEAVAMVDRDLILAELARVWGDHVKIERALKRVGPFVAVNTTNVRSCNYCGRNHSSRRLSARFYPDHWQEYCWDEDARGVAPICHPYNHPEDIVALLFPQDVMDAEEDPSEFQQVRERVLQVYPEDTDAWEEATELWQLGAYFGPCSTNAYSFDYRWGFCALLRRTKRGARDPYSCRVRPSPWNETHQENEYDADLGHALLEACREHYKEERHLLLLPHDECIHFYGTHSGQPTAILRFHVHPAILIKGEKRRLTVPAAVSQACRLFHRSMRLLPVNLHERARDQQRQWEAVLESGPPGSTFTLDEGGPRDPVRWMPPLAGGNAITVVVAPCGSGKTNGLVQRGFRGDIVTCSRLLARNAAQRFGCAHQMEPDGETVRSAQELVAEPRPLCWLVHSIRGVVGRPITELFIDEVTAVLQAVAGALLRDQRPDQVLQLLVSLLQRVQNPIVASADCTAQLEGVLFARHMHRPLQVIYKVQGPSAAAMPCIEFATDAEMWDAYVRILQQRGRVRLYFACTTVAAVERARHLAERYWPDGSYVFVHAQRPAPAGFVENPNVSWLQYTVVCVSNTIKVGVSFEVPNYFHAVFLYACTGCGTAEDALQLAQRPRANALFFGLRIRNIGGGGREAELTAAATEQALDAFAEERHFARESLGAVFRRPQVVPTLFEWLRGQVAAHERHDQLHFRQRIHELLRQRQMTIALGGVPRDEPLRIGDEMVLEPLPPNTDLSGPDRVQERIERILEAPDLTERQAFDLRNRRGPALPEDQVALERYNIRCLYRADGPLPFESLVEQHVRHKLGARVVRCRLILHPDAGVAAGLDEHELLHCEPWETHHHALQRRQRARALLCTLPGFAPEMLLGGGGVPYRVTRRQIQAQVEVQAGVLPRVSVLADPVERAMANVRSLTRLLLGADPWVPHVVRLRTPDGRRVRVTRDWTLGPLPAEARAVLYYAGLDLPGGAAAVERVRFEAPAAGWNDAAFVHAVRACAGDLEAHVQVARRGGVYVVSYAPPDIKYAIRHVLTTVWHLPLLPEVEEVEEEEHTE